MNAIDFLNVANRLHTSTDEAERRTSISRSYYATYHVLVQALSTKQIKFEGTAEDHGRLTYYLANSGDHRTQKIGGFLKTLRIKRGDADYNMRSFIKAWDSQLLYQTASNAITQFGAIPGPDLDHIARVIKVLAQYVPNR